MSFVLVVVAAIALVIGLLQSGLGIIYVSIACSVAAGIVLVIAVLRGRPEARPGARAEPRPAAEAAPPPPAPAAADTMVSAPAAPPPPPPSPAPPSEREPVLAGAGRGGGRAAAGAAAATDRTEQLEQVEVEESVAVDDGFPIHDYDKLRATEILPILAELDEEQLEAVRQREQVGKNRFMILSRIDDELQAREGEGWGAEDEGWQVEEEEVAVAVAVAEPEPEPEPPRRAAVPLGRAAPGAFPIPDYDELRALEILGRLSDLDAAELEAVRQREQAGARRAMILHRIDRLLEDAGPEPSAEPGEPVIVTGVDEPASEPVVGRRRRAAKAPATKRAAGTKRAAAGGAQAAKAPARTRAASKTAAAKKAPVAKKAAVRKVAVRKVAVKKVAAKKAPVTKKAATKAAATGRAAKAPATKGRVVKKTTRTTKKATKRT